MPYDYRRTVFGEKREEQLLNSTGLPPALTAQRLCQPKTPPHPWREQSKQLLGGIGFAISEQAFGNPSM